MLNDKPLAQIGVCVIFLDNLLVRIQQRTNREQAPLAHGHTEKAFIELLSQYTDETKRKSVTRRITRGGTALSTTIVAKYGIPASLVGLCRYVAKARIDGDLKVTEGTHAAFVFELIGQHIEGIVHGILEESSDIEEIQQAIAAEVFKV